MRRPSLRRPVAAAAAVLVVGAGASACSWSGWGVLDDFTDAFDTGGRDAGDVTCGEWLDQSVEQQREGVVALIEDSDDDAVKDSLDEFEGAERDAFLDSIAQYVTQQCESEGDDDTVVGEFVYEDF